MTTSGWIAWGVLMLLWFGVVAPLNNRRQDRLWREHREEQSRLDREAGVNTSWLGR